MYLSESDKEKIIEICKRNDVFYCAVFGSFASGEATDESDIDLLVRLSRRMGWEFFGIQIELEEALGRQVDLATEGCLSSYIRDNVMRDLQVIYEDKQFAPAASYS